MMLPSAHTGPEARIKRVDVVKMVVVVALFFLCLASWFLPHRYV
jgi:hypothetical protein